MTNKTVRSVLNAQWKNLWELFILHPRAGRKLYQSQAAALSKVSPDSASAATLRKTSQRKKTAGSPETGDAAWTVYCSKWTTAAPAFPASPKASEIAWVWDSQGKFCYALQRNVPPTTVVSSHKRIISEIISEVHGIVYRFYWNVAPGRGSQMSQTILRLLHLEEILGQNFKKADALKWETLRAVEKGAFLSLELLK